MKNFRLFILLSLIVPTMGTSAQTLSPDPTPTDVPIIPRVKDIGNRPKAPSRQKIECSYGDGYLYLSFAISEGNCQLVVTDLLTGAVRSYYFDSSREATLYIGSLTSAYIHIITANGNEYEGYIE